MADSDGRALLVNLHKKVVLHHFNFKQPVRDIKYSPNGRSVQWQVRPKVSCLFSRIDRSLLVAWLLTNVLENVEHCGDEPEQADTGILLYAVP